MKVPLADPKNDTLLSTAPEATFFVVSTVLAKVSEKVKINLNDNPKC